MFSGNTLTIKTIILLIIVTGAVASLFSMISSKIYMSDAHERLNIRTNQEMNRISEELSLPLWDLNFNQIDKFVSFELNNEIISGLTITDTKNKIIISKYKIISEGKTIILSSLPDKKRYFIKKERTITHNEIPIGKLYLFITDSGIKKDTFDRILSNLIQTVTMIFVLAMTLYVFFNKLFLSRILTINDKITQTTGGNYSVKIPEDGIDELSSISRNINRLNATIQKRERDLMDANSKVKELTSYLSNIINSMPSMLVSIDENGSVTQWNHAASVITGVSQMDAMGKQIWDILPQMDKYRDNILEVISVKKMITFTRKNFFENGEKLYDITFFPLSDGAKGVVFRIDDSTELERKDTLLRQAQKMETIGMLAGGLAHDFNNILGGIIGPLTIINLNILDKEKIESSLIKNELDLIEQSAHRAADIVTHFLNLSRSKEADFRPIDLGEALSHVIKICKNTFDKSIEIIDHFLPDHYYIFGDQTQMEQVFLNISINAAHAMTIMRLPEETNGGKLTIAVNKITADSFFCDSHPEATPGDYWGISIIDTGVGMDQKALSKIFDPFFTTKEKGKGTGLGLAVVYNIIHSHKGFIDVYSQVGNGSVFNVFLPVHYEAPMELHEKETLIEQGYGLILVVDDDDIIRETARAILEKAGYEVLTAENGEDGVKKYIDNKNSIRAVILDMAMPVKSGKHAFEEIMATNPGAVIMISSGFKQENMINMMMKKGLAGFLQKPYNGKQLTEALKAAFDKKSKEALSCSK